MYGWIQVTQAGPIETKRLIRVGNLVEVQGASPDGSRLCIRDKNNSNSGYTALVITESLEEITARIAEAETPPPVNSGAWVMPL